MVAAALFIAAKNEVTGYQKRNGWIDSVHLYLEHYPRTQKDEYDPQEVTRRDFHERLVTEKRCKRVYDDADFHKRNRDM